VSKYPGLPLFQQSIAEYAEKRAKRREKIMRWTVIICLSASIGCMLWMIRELQHIRQLLLVE